MEPHRRYLASQVESDLSEKMVFLSGPRQVGKTTLARTLPGAAGGYLNWDSPEDRDRLLRNRMPKAPLWTLDEIHKYRGWRNWLKGLWDTRQPGQRVLVTGSARLDLYRYGGDSLQGRYLPLRLHPFSAAELDIRTVPQLKDLLTLGGFPEPFLRGSQAAARRWSIHYRQQLIHEEVTSLEQVVDLGTMELLMISLPERVGSPLSINSLRENLLVKHRTVERWIQVFERLHAIYRLPPFGAPLLRAVKKEQKHYHMDWSLVPEPGPRFENLVAGHLLKWVHREQDVEGRDLELRYFRDTDGREVDFVVVEKRNPILMVEAKLGDAELDRGIRYLHERFPSAEAWQVSLDGKNGHWVNRGIHIAPVLELLSRLA